MEIVFVARRGVLRTIIDAAARCIARLHGQIFYCRVYRAVRVSNGGDRFSGEILQVCARRGDLVGDLG